MPDHVMLRVGDISIAATTTEAAEKPALVLLHGWPQSRALYDGVIEELGKEFFVLAMDLPEVGSSRGAPPSAEKTVLADLVLRAAEEAGARDIIIAGLDVGGMIAFAAVRDHGGRIKRAIVMNTVIPGLDPWDELLAEPRIWHFAFHSIPDLPETLVSGHERKYFDFFHDTLAGDPKRISSTLRDEFAKAYARPEALKAGFDWYRAMAKDAEHNKRRKKIATPLLYVRGDAGGRSIDPYVAGLKAAGAEDIKGRIISDAGELLPLEAPEAFIATMHEALTPKD